MKRGLPVGLILLLGVSSLHAMGMLQPKPKMDTAPEPFLLIGQKVPDSLTVMDKDEKIRPLLSYKSGVEMMVLGFYSVNCPGNIQTWRDVQKLVDTYSDWHVVFLGVSFKDEPLPAIQDALTRAGQTYPLVRDHTGQAAQLMHISATPELIIIDEWGTLRYRGPSDLKTVRQALDAVIGHVDPVANPEPNFSGCLLP